MWGNRPLPGLQGRSGANIPITAITRRTAPKNLPTAHSAWAGRVFIPTYPQNPPQRGGDRVWFYRAVVEERNDWFSEEQSTGK